jgi:hypothetical protein
MNNRRLGLVLIPPYPSSIRTSSDWMKFFLRSLGTKKAGRRKPALPRFRSSTKHLDMEAECIFLDIGISIISVNRKIECD